MLGEEPHIYFEGAYLNIDHHLISTVNEWNASRQIELDDQKYKELALQLKVRTANPFVLTAEELASFPEKSRHPSRPTFFSAQFVKRAFNYYGGKLHFMQN